MGYGPSEELLVLGDEGNGLALMKVVDFERQMNDLMNAMK